jgi:hypothetical protein
VSVRSSSLQSSGSKGYGLTIVVDNSAPQTITLEHGESVHSLALAEKVGGFHVGRTGEEIVHLAATARERRRVSR